MLTISDSECSKVDFSFKMISFHNDGDFNSSLMDVGKD